MNASSSKRPRILVISELFPTPPRPARGIFVERQTSHLTGTCEFVVVSPTRIFPHLRLWQAIEQPRSFASAWGEWRSELAAIPRQAKIHQLPVYYPRYTSLPRQIFHGTWGHSAYLFLRNLLKQLHHQHQFDLIHAHYAVPSGVVALLAQKWMQVPVVVSVHGADLAYTVHQRIGGSVVRSVFRQADAILANSQKTVQGIQQAGASADKIHLVRLGANPHANHPTNSPAELRDTFQILSVGYLIPQKGHAYVLQAIAALRDQGYKLRYTLVGDGPEEKKLRKLAGQLGISELVTFAGYQTHDQVWPYFADCDIFVLPSWNEAFGMVYIEALSLGKPVIGCAGEGGPDDLKTLGDCIALVKPRDPTSLVQALKRLLDEPATRQAMGQTGQEIVNKYYRWQHTAEATLKIYQQLLE